MRCIEVLRLSFRVRPGLQWRFVAEISASLCTDAVQKYGDRDFGGRERWLYFSARQKGRHSRLVPQELCPPVLGNYRGSYRWNSQSRISDKDRSGEGLAFFFFLKYFKTVTAGVRQPGNWVRSSLGYWVRPSFWNVNSYKGWFATRECSEKMPGAGSNSYGIRE